MIGVHKIQERLATYSQLYRSLPGNHIEKSDPEALKGKTNYVRRVSELLDVAVKFDLGEVSQDNSQSLFDTGKECASAGLLRLPFEITYVEATLEDDNLKRRYGSVFAPASACFEEKVFNKCPEFVGGIGALNFSRINKSDATQSFWEIPKLIAVISRDFTETYSAPATKGFINYEVLTEHQYQKVASINTTILYIMHSLINARGVEFQTELAPVKLNRRRIQKNKPPLYEHRTIKIGGYSSSGRVLGVGASHASPRAHWRRGHIRTIRRGTPQQKRIAIPACLISGPGFVSKDYEVRQ
jgi:hypothetical protein